MSEGISRFDALNRQVTAVTLKPWRDGQADAAHREREAAARRQPRAADIRAVDRGRDLLRPAEDVYVVFTGQPGETAEIRITFNPLVWWVWYGGMIMALGGLIVMWPQADRARAQSGYAAGMRSAARSRASVVAP